MVIFGNLYLELISFRITVYSVFSLITIQITPKSAFQIQTAHLCLTYLYYLFDCFHLNGLSCILQI